jgi:DedD protein
MSLLHRSDEYEEEAPERELTLSTGALLGIFAGLVGLCALFFVLGYTMRGRQIPKPMVVATTDNTPASTANFDSFKPAAGQPVNSQPLVTSTHVSEAALAPRPHATEEASTSAPPVPKEAAPLVHPSPAAPIVRVPPPAPVAAVHPAAVPSAAAAPIPAGSFVVQVAAVSHAEDANFVVSALKARGYPAAARTTSQDSLYHIQVGPYPTRQAADAIKQRLAADGYNSPIVK